MRPLNFSSQPFRNETLPALLFGAASVLLLAGTVYHGFVVRGLFPARTSKLHQEVASLEAEVDRLRTEARGLRAPTPDKTVIAEWSVLKDLVDRRTFSWTGLFARLEQVLPREVRLVSIAPTVAQGQVILDVIAVARPPQAGLSLVGVLEGRGEFEDVYPESLSEKEDGTAEFHYTMQYLPGVASDPIVTPAAATEEPEEELEDAPPPEAADAKPSAPSPSAAASAAPSMRPSPPPPQRPVRDPRVPPRKPQPGAEEDEEPSTDGQEKLN